VQTRHIAAMYTGPLIEDVERDFAAPASDSDCITLSSAKTDMFDIKTIPSNLGLIKILSKLYFHVILWISCPMHTSVRVAPIYSYPDAVYAASRLSRMCSPWIFSGPCNSQSDCFASPSLGALGGSSCFFFHRLLSLGVRAAGDKIMLLLHPRSVLISFSSFTSHAASRLLSTPRAPSSSHAS